MRTVSRKHCVRSGLVVFHESSPSTKGPLQNDDMAENLKVSRTEDGASKVTDAFWSLDFFWYQLPVPVPAEVPMLEKISQLSFNF